VAPAAGFAESETTALPAENRDYLSSIAAARQEAQMLFELSHDLGTSLSLDDTLSMLSVRLKRLVPHDSMAVYIKRDEQLVPEFVSGDNFRLFSSLKIPLGQGLSGWVAQNNKPILNGNPSVEPGYLNDPTKYSTLRSALAVPLEGVSEVVATLALYRSDQDAFNQDHLPEDSATTDYLTGLPNARSLFLYLDREIARCRRSSSPIAVLLCDLDGFKQVNDRFGHLQGNRVLQMFAAALKDCCREYDYAARMGGDEFVIVAPGLDAYTAAEMVHRLENIVREAGRNVCGDEMLSVSIGCAFYPENATEAEQLLAEADRAMYGIKRLHHAAPSDPQIAKAAGAGDSAN
jgi:diguanylate cyclase (GGDEF)-like protein